MLVVDRNKSLLSINVIPITIITDNKADIYNYENEAVNPKTKHIIWDITPSENLWRKITLIWNMLYLKTIYQMDILNILILQR